jgi:hypothetical protein
MKNGPGLMFADAEFLIIVTIFFVVCGIVSLWISKRIKKNLTH